MALAQDGSRIFTLAHPAGFPDLDPATSFSNDGAVLANVFQRAIIGLAGFVLAGDTSAEAWIKTLLQDELPAQAYGRLLLLPGAKAPVAVQSRGKPVCTCLNVTDSAIAAQLAAIHAEAGSTAMRQSEAGQLANLQAALHCGTQCGSCVPELKRLVRASQPAAASRVIPIHAIST
jgi:assimilatory nitrate reductase catalytic subunit